MPCPQPLDPLCIAIMLRMTAGPLDPEIIARDLHVDCATVDTRMNRLEAIGAVVSGNGSGEFTLHPNAYRIVLDLSHDELAVSDNGRPARGEDTRQARLRRLQADPMFCELPPAELAWLATVSRTQSVAAGELLLLEGDECRGLYIVDSGTIRLSKGSSSCAFGYGREQTIRLMTAGESFNEVPVFDGGVNPVTAETIEESRVIFVPKGEVQNLVGRSPHFAKVIIRIMSQRLRHMLAMIEDVSMRDVTGRVAKILLQLQHPTDGVGAGLRVGRRLTQREIGEMAGTAREVVARVLKKMERTGAIRVNRGDVQIIDPELLESFT